MMAKRTATLYELNIYIGIGYSIPEPTQPHRSQPALRPSAPAAARQRPPVSDFFARGTPTMVDEAASACFSFSTPARVCLIVASCSKMLEDAFLGRRDRGCL